MTAVPWKLSHVAGEKQKSSYRVSMNVAICCLFVGAKFVQVNGQGSTITASGLRSEHQPHLN